MDNLLHSLVGAAIGGRLVPSSASAPVRRAVLGAAIVAANVPDLDFAYVWITEPPLGFLLHHRGHTHTVAGAMLLAGLILLAVGLWQQPRRQEALSPPRLALVIGLAVFSHILIDAANVFGVVFWYPLSTTWVFGDLSFIFEPWLWMVLGVPIARSASTTVRSVVLSAVTMAAVAAVAWQLVPIVTLPMLAAAGLAWWRVSSATCTRRRLTMALVGAATLFALLGVLSSTSRRHFEREMAGIAPGSAVVDVVLEPDPGTPWCWSGLVVSLDEGVGGALTIRRGTLSLLSRLWPASSCASARLFGAGVGPDDAKALVWVRVWEMPVKQLRALHANSCHAAAWLRFGRAPMVIDGSLRDLRLENPVHENFTAMALERAPPPCPSSVPPWAPPRADALDE